MKVRLRDGRCRLAGARGFPACGGPSEWAHLRPHARFQTRGEAPERRHTTAGSLMLCRLMHHLYDAHRMAIEAEDADRGADGPLRFELDGAVYRG